MFVRVKTTPNSPRRSVQVVESLRSGGKVSQKIVRYIGIALDDAEEAKMRAMGNEFIERAAAADLNQDSLFAVDSVSVRRAGRPARQSIASVAAASSVALTDVEEVSRRVEGPDEVLGHLYDYLRFDHVLGDKRGAGRGAAMLRDLVIARSMVCGSKRECARALEVDYGKTYTTDSLYRLMDGVHERLTEDSFRLMKHNLAIRPIYHFKPERIKAHIGICFLAFALIRHAQQRIKLAQKAMSTEDIRRALHSVQASILEHKKTKAKYRLPSAFSQDATRIYKAFDIKRDLDAGILLE